VEIFKYFVRRNSIISFGGSFGDFGPQRRSVMHNLKAFGQCRRPLLHLESAWVQAAQQAAKLLAARLQGCRLQGCELQG
jgi:hypothetical protein